MALTVNSALYLLMVRPKKTYKDNPEVLEYASAEEKELLELEREGKTAVSESSLPLRTRVLHVLVHKYKTFMHWILETKFNRMVAIIMPIIIFIAGIFLL